MSFRFFRKIEDRHALALSMAGVKLGDRVLQVGCRDGGLLAALAGKAGLSGRACCIDEDAAAVTIARDAAARAGVLVEAETAPLTLLPYTDEAFDLVVVRTPLAGMQPERRVSFLREAARVLRGGGRCVVIEQAPRGGLGALLSRSQAYPNAMPPGGAERVLQAEGFKAVRRLAERDGVAFIEAVKGREA